MLAVASYSSLISDRTSNGICVSASHRTIVGSDVVMNPGNHIPSRDLLIHRKKVDMQTSASGGDGVPHPLQLLSIRHRKKGLVSHHIYPPVSWSCLQMALLVALPSHNSIGLTPSVTGCPKLQSEATQLWAVRFTRLLATHRFHYFFNLSLVPSLRKFVMYNGR